MSHWHLNDEEHGAVDSLRPPVEAVEAVAVLLRAEEAVPLVALEAGRQVAVEQLPLVVTHLEGVQFYKGGGNVAVALAVIVASATALNVIMALDVTVADLYDGWER